MQLMQLMGASRCRVGVVPLLRFRTHADGRRLRLIGLAPEIPEDLYCLIKKAVSVRKHLDKFRGDTDAKFRLILIE